MKSKIVTAEQAIALMHDGDTLVCSGFGVVGVPDELLLALQQRFEATQSPRELTLIFGGGPGDGKEQGVNRIAIDGLIQRAIGGHWGLVPKLSAMAMENRIEAWNLPLSVIELAGQELLFYRLPKPQVAFIRASIADPDGNLSIEREALAPMPFDERKIIARRAAFELMPNAVVNLGIGMPEGVADSANEERLLSYMTLTAEPGVVERQCQAIGHRVDVVVNYDGFEIRAPVMDAYARVVERVVERYYGQVTRYTTSAFLRDKLGSAIRERGLAPHIYETRAEAEAAL